MSKTETENDNTIYFAEHIGLSSSFKNLFTEGMVLVEETASYLDGEGRVESKKLTKTTSILYASESMRLTTRLMQLASWLLLQRSANEGDMTSEQLANEKKKIKLDQSRSNNTHMNWSELPETFRALVARSRALSNRIDLLDKELYSDKTEQNLSVVNPVSAQIDILNAAFGR